MSVYTKPLPVLEGENAPHWLGAREREVRVQRCLGCTRLRFPAARYCSNCLSEQSDWVAMSGRGEIWSHCRFHRVYFKGFEGEMPYTVVLIKLDEGPMLYSNMVGLSEDEIRIGMRVQAVFDDVTDDVTLIKFQPE
jgi:uncharacterized OB-fold protein